MTQPGTVSPSIIDDLTASDLEVMLQSTKTKTVCVLLTLGIVAMALEKWYLDPQGRGLSLNEEAMIVPASRGTTHANASLPTAPCSFVVYHITTLDFGVCFYINK